MEYSPLCFLSNRRWVAHDKLILKACLGPFFCVKLVWDLGELTHSKNRLKSPDQPRVTMEQIYHGVGLLVKCLVQL